MYDVAMLRRSLQQLDRMVQLGTSALSTNQQQTSAASCGTKAWDTAKYSPDVQAI